jgi:hypothetical protein
MSRGVDRSKRNISIGEFLLSLANDLTDYGELVHRTPPGKSAGRITATKERADFMRSSAAPGMNVGQHLEPSRTVCLDPVVGVELGLVPFALLDEHVVQIQ